MTNHDVIRQYTSCMFPLTVRDGDVQVQVGFITSPSKGATYKVCAEVAGFHLKSGDSWLSWLIFCHVLPLCLGLPCALTLRVLGILCQRLAKDFMGFFTVKAKSSNH